MPDAGEPPNHATYVPVTPRQRPWDKDICVPLPADAGFTDAEHWAWSKIIRGEIADMRLSTGKDDGAGDNASEEIEGENGEKTLKPWPETRKLSARFFDTVLFHEPWASAKAKSWARIRYAWVTEDLNWGNTDVKDELWLDSARIDAQLIWDGARFAGSVSLDGARLAQEFSANDVLIGGGLYCRRLRAQDEISFRGTRIVGGASFVDANLARGLGADGLQVTGGLFCRGAFKADGPVALLGARIGSNAEFDDATLTEGLDADGIRIEGALFCRGDFKAEGIFDLLGARIGGNAQLTGTFNARVNLTGANIDGELQFDQGGQSRPTWGENTRIVLRNVTCGALAGAIASFRRTDTKGKCVLSVPVDLLGLSYARIGGLRQRGAQAGATLADASTRELIAFLQSDAPKNGIFNPQPYRQLADALMAAGREEKAHKLRFALLEHERSAKGVPLTRKAALFLSRHLIGHGFENWRAAIGFGLVVLATAAIGLWYQGHPFVTSTAAMDFRAMGDWGGYALGNSIPLLELDPAHKTFVEDRFGETAPLGLKTWLYSFKLLGFIMLSYLAAGLSGFASRSARG